MEDKDKENNNLRGDIKGKPLRDKTRGRYDNNRQYGTTESMLEKKLMGMTYREIAEMEGCTAGTVFQRLKPYIKQIESFSLSKQRETDLYRFKAFEAISYITPDKLKKSTAYQLALIAGMMHDHALKCEGKFDNTIDLQVINLDLRKLKEEKELLYTKLNEIASDVIDNARSES